MIAEVLLHAMSVVAFISKDAPGTSWFGQGYLTDEYGRLQPSACIMRCCDHERCNRRDAIACFTAWYEENLRWKGN